MKAIEFENVSKQYRLGAVSGGTIGSDLSRWWAIHVRHQEDPLLKVGESNDRSKKGFSDYVWALKDINFSIEEGDVVGIVGRNGAGKSTLLKLLSRVTAPTTGIIRANGRIASLLEVGTGFHPEMTGRENIYMNGAILGMSRAEIKSKFDEIVDFSGVERYIDTPVKRYSSGMIVRLGFAIAAHIEPEILVVDEVLAVGDAEFQKKALGKMNEVSSTAGRTVIFVSHNMAAVKTLCRTGILMENGRISESGEIKDITEKYLNKQNLRSSVSLADIKERKGNGYLRFMDVKFLNSKNELPESFNVGEEMKISLFVKTTKEYKKCTSSWIELGINDMLGTRITWFSTQMFYDKMEDSGVITFRIPRLLLGEGEYNITLVCHTSAGLADWIINVGRFRVVMENFYRTGRKIPANQGVVTDYVVEWE